MKTNTQIRHDWTFCSGFSPWPHLWPRVCLLLLPPCWIWAPAENLWELRQVSCPGGSFPLRKVPSTAGRLLLCVSDTCSLPRCFTTGRYQSHQCFQVHVQQHWPTHFQARLHVGIHGPFKVISKPTHTHHHFAKGISLLQGWELVSGRCSPSSPDWGINRMARIFLSLGPQSHPLGHHVRPPNKHWDQPLSNPLWLPRWFKVSHLLLLPAPSQLSFRCSPNFCCVPLWLLICTASVTIAKQNINMSVSSLIFSTIHTLTAFGVRSKTAGMDSAPRTSCPHPHTIPRALQSRLADGRRQSKTKRKTYFGSGKWGRTLLFIKVKLFEVFRIKQISQI